MSMSGISFFNLFKCDFICLFQSYQSLELVSKSRCLTFKHICSKTRQTYSISEFTCYDPCGLRLLWTSTRPHDWSKAVSDAEKVVGYPTSFMSLRCLLSDEIANVALQMRKLVGTKHPLLKTARRLMLDGKSSMQTRGLTVLLISKAAGRGKTEEPQDVHKQMVGGIYPSQRTLAEITEMIYMANLIHKGVVNVASLGGDAPIKDLEFGNKMAVLSGDFLLANASNELAQLGNTYVVESISGAIAEMMEAEFIGNKDKHGAPLPIPSYTFSDWLEQTYLSSACLLAKSCKSALLLANHDEEMQTAAFEFGKQMSFAYQLNEDIRPFVNSSDIPECVNLHSAPIIHYMERCESTERNALLPTDAQHIDCNMIFNKVKESSAIQKCRTLSTEYGDKAMDAIDIFEKSDAKDALHNIIKAITYYTY